MHAYTYSIDTAPWSSRSRQHRYCVEFCKNVPFYLSFRDRLDGLDLVPTWCIAVPIRSTVRSGPPPFPITWIAGCLQCKADVYPGSPGLKMCIFIQVPLFLIFWIRFGRYASFLCEIWVWNDKVRKRISVWNNSLPPSYYTAYYNF